MTCQLEWRERMSVELHVETEDKSPIVLDVIEPGVENLLV
jgi:hypothetical protein